MRQLYGADREKENERASSDVLLNQEPLCLRSNGMIRFSWMIS